MTPADLDIEALTVLDSMPQHIVLVDDAGTVVAVNRAWREFGRRNGAAGGGQDSLGLNYIEVCRAVGGVRFAAQACEGLESVLQGREPLFELVYPFASESEDRWFLMRVSPLVGRRQGAVVSHEDITERWHLEQQRGRLVNELLDLKAALDAHALVAITDRQGRITYVNDKFCAISKWSREQLLGRDHRIVNSGHHGKDFFRELWRTISSGQIWQGELKNRARDGSFYWVDTTIVPLLGADGKPIQYIAIRAEITQRKALEAQAHISLEELTAANRELAEFAYVVSHDLKAPLRGISSLANWLVRDCADRLGTEGAGQLHLIVSRVKRMSGLIDGILAYSRVGRTRAERSPVPLEALLRNIIDLLAPPPHIIVEVADPLPRLTVQPVQMQQLFQNLLSNAIDFMDKPQGLIRVGCVREGAVWHFTVADNGPGIEARYFERVFQLFQTLNTRDELERTGVGLALVKKIVELEGGRLWIESAVGMGTTFHFTLPAAEEGA